MKKLINAITLTLLLLASQAQASTIIEFTDSVNYWPGFSNDQNGVSWYESNTKPNDLDVWGTPDLLKGAFTLDNQNRLIQISLTYKYPTLSGLNTFTLGDWFFGANVNDGWDYVLSSPVNSNWTALTSNKWNIYDVQNVDFESEYTDVSDAYLYSKSPSNYIPRKEHPVKAIVDQSMLTGGQATLSGWKTSGLTIGKEYTAIWDLSNNPLNIKFNESGAFYYAFAVTCANDVIYGDPPIPTPEPTTLLLLGFGLVGLGAVARKRRN